MLEIKIKTDKNIPVYMTPGSSGADLQYTGDCTVIIPAGERRLLSTGICIAIPEGYEAQIRPRSGLANKYGVTVLNSPATIDCDFRGEIKVILINHGTRDFPVYPGDRIAQIVFNKIEQVKFVLVSELTQTERGEGGFGHTGTARI